MRSGNKFLTILTLAWMLALAGCADASGVDRSAPVDASHRFTLKDTRGQDVSLDSLLQKNKAVLVNFWATWCPPCREEIPDLIDLYTKNKDKGLAVVGIDVGESAGKVSTFMERAGINYPVLLDSRMSVSEEYRVVGIPTTYLFSPEGKIIGEYHGFTPKLVSDVEKALK